MTQLFETEINHREQQFLATGLQFWFRIKMIITLKEIALNLQSVLEKISELVFICQIKTRERLSQAAPLNQLSTFISQLTIIFLSRCWYFERRTAFQ